MRIWTIQNEAAWEYLICYGKLQAESQHQFDEWPHAYDWMRDQLIKRVGHPPRKDVAPLWGWFHWANANKKRPDIRSLRHHWKPAGDYILIECDLSDNHVILSDFHAWNVILGGSYLGRSDEECDDFEKALAACGWKRGNPIPDKLKGWLYRSWERVIDMKELEEPYWHDMKKKSIQACFWEIRMDQILSHKSFTSKINHR